MNPNNTNFAQIWFQQDFVPSKMGALLVIIWIQLFVDDGLEEELSDQPLHIDLSRLLL